jgi:aldehyde dehydrogenase (NAD+)
MSNKVSEMAATGLERTDRFFIGGEWVQPSSDAAFEVVVPATEEPYARFAGAQAADVERAVTAARKAFDEGPWPAMSHAARAAYLRVVAKRLDERADDIARVLPNEMGILHSDASLFARAMGSVFEYYAGLADTFAFEEPHHPAAGGAIGLLVREPVGVVAAIVAWNGAIVQLAYKLAPALLAGCTVVAKAPPEEPATAHILAQVVEQAGLPPGVFNVITADREVSELLVRHPGVDKVAFTGSSAAGRRIAAICGDRMARFTLELGGKSAAVILDDFDVEAAARAISGPACWLSGQVCSSLTRIVVSRARHDQLVDALSTVFGKLKVGDPFDPTVQMGPVAMRRQRDRIEGIIARGKASGATLAVGGGRPAHLPHGFFVEPTVFGHVDNHSVLAQEEIFGPVLSVIPADSEEQAIAIANDTVYGLNNSVFTNDPDRAYRVARRLRSGTVGHNIFRTDFSIAFGGFKQSGMGREGGTEGLMPYLETKTVILEGAPSHLKS